MQIKSKLLSDSLDRHLLRNPNQTINGVVNVTVCVKHFASNFVIMVQKLSTHNA